MAFASAVDATIHFLVGPGEGPVCLVPTSIGVVPYERMLRSSLGGRCRPVFVDPRGAGASTGDPRALTWEVLRDDLEAVRRELAVDRVAVLGHSILGALAIEYARRSPETVAGVIAVGTPPTGDLAAVERTALAFFEADASPERLAAWNENRAALPPAPTLAQVLAADTPRRFFDPRTDVGPLFAGATVRPDFFAHLLGPLIEGWHVLAASPPLSTPLVVVHGRYDYVVPSSLWAAVLPALPHGSQQVLAHSSHHPFVDEPAAFGAVVSEFLGRIG